MSSTSTVNRHQPGSPVSPTRTHQPGSPTPSLKRSPSLRSTCEHWLGLLMDKEEQRSEWSSRPLQPEQLSYAALDASICLDVLEAMEVDWQGSDVDGPKLF